MGMKNIYLNISNFHDKLKEKKLCDSDGGVYLICKKAIQKSNFETLEN